MITSSSLLSSNFGLIDDNEGISVRAASEEWLTVKATTAKRNMPLSLPPVRLCVTLSSVFTVYARRVLFWSTL